MSATLRLSLFNAAGEDLADDVRVELFGISSSQHLEVRERVAGNLLITGVVANPVALYRVIVSPSNHRVMQFFINLTDGQEAKFSLAIPVEPSKVASLSSPGLQQLPSSAQGILNMAQCPAFVRGGSAFITGDDLYRLWDSQPLLKACFLNIVAKSAATPLMSAGTCLDRYGALLRIAQDRVFVKTSASLLEDVERSPLFHPVSFSLHNPLPGYTLVASYKTPDLYGNLQLTFQRRGETGDDYVVDVDIDDAQGIQHIFQVLRNSVAGPTNPYDIHDILLQQKPRVDPGYDFVFAAVAAFRAS